MLALLDKYSLNRPLPFHPVLLAAFPVLFLYAFNIRETDIQDAFFPMFVVVTGTVLLWFSLTILLGDGRKAGVATSLFVILFFSYGHLYDFAARWDFFHIPHSRMIAATVLFWAYFVYFLRFASWNPRGLTRVLNLAGSTLIILNLGRITLYETFRRPPEYSPAETVADAAGDLDPAGLPDIYYLIFDEFAHPETMARYFDYDAGPFINTLAAAGFYIADRSRTHTLSTDQVLASVLNMEYISSSHPRLFKMIGDSALARFLRLRGYRYIYFGSFHEFGRWQKHIQRQADEYHNYYTDKKRGLLTEFQTIFWNTTLLRPIYFHIMGASYESYHRHGVTGVLEHLQRLPEEPGPKFVFAHLMLPHEPFVFGPEGEFISPSDYSNYSDRQIYLGQYIYAAGRILELAETLLENSPTPPIVIIQSDHGLRSHHPGVNISAEEGRKVLNAIYFPDSGSKQLYDSISPVNTVRLMLNHFFNADYPLLEDPRIPSDESTRDRK